MCQRSSSFVDEYGVEIQKIEDINPTSSINLQYDYSAPIYNLCSQNIMDFSFENNATNENVEVIIQAWHSMLASCLQKEEQINYHNSQDFRNFPFKQENIYEKKITEVVLTNNFLTIQQKKLMIKKIKHESTLASTILELNQLLEEDIFNQILYIIFYIWKEFSQMVNQKISNCSLPQKFFPRILNLDDWRQEQYQCLTEKLGEQQIIKNLDSSELLKKAEKISDNLSMSFYYKDDLKILLFKEQKKNPRCNQLIEFKKFLDVLCNAIFLSSANFYQYFDRSICYKRNYKAHLHSIENFLSENCFNSSDEFEVPPRKLRKFL